LVILLLLSIITIYGDNNGTSSIKFMASPGIVHSSITQRGSTNHDYVQADVGIGMFFSFGDIHVLHSDFLAFIDANQVATPLNVWGDIAGLGIGNDQIGLSEVFYMKANQIEIREHRDVTNILDYYNFSLYYWSDACTVHSTEEDCTSSDGCYYCHGTFRRPSGFCWGGTAFLDSMYSVAPWSEVHYADDENEGKVGGYCPKKVSTVGLIDAAGNNGWATDGLLYAVIGISVVTIAIVGYFLYNPAACCWICDRKTREQGVTYQRIGQGP